MNPLSAAAAGVEIALFLWGLWLIWRLALSPAARSAQRSARLPAWDIPKRDFVLMLCLAATGALAASALAGTIVRWRQLDRDASLVLGGAALHLGILAGLLAFYLGFAPRPAADSSRSVGALRSGAATFLITLPIVIGISNGSEFVLRILGLPAGKQELVSILENTDSMVLRVTLVIIATLLVPITEELLFRAGLFRYLRSRIPRQAALLLTALLFGALHVDWTTMGGLASLVPLTVLAVIFSIAYERTGNIGTTMVAHALFNLNTFVLIAAGAGA
jgi:uncharacterized protein